MSDARDRADPMEIIFFGLSDVGRLRENNEDSLFVGEGFGDSFAGVCDGLGGAPAGEVASQIAAQQISRELSLLCGTSHLRGSQVRFAIEAANREVYRRSRTDPGCRGMATTATAIMVSNRILEVGHAGDSRAYLLRGGDLLQLTEDHTVAAELVRQGKIPREEARQALGTLTSAVGVDKEIDVDVGFIEVEPGNVILLCTDGLWDMVPNDQIRSILIAQPDPRTACEALIRAALEAGGRDNVTVIVGACGGGRNK